METKLLLPALGVWVVLAFLAVGNAILREVVYAPILGSYYGHLISTISLVIIIFLVTFLFLRQITIVYTAIDLLEVGSIWLVLTIAFEFLAGHFLFGNPWSDLLQDYNILAGRIWILVLISMFIAPYIVGTILQR